MTSKSEIFNLEEAVERAKALQVDKEDGSARERAFYLVAGIFRQIKEHDPRVTAEKESEVNLIVNIPRVVLSWGPKLHLTREESKLLYDNRNRRIDSTGDHLPDRILEASHFITYVEVGPEVLEVPVRITTKTGDQSVEYRGLPIETFLADPMTIVPILDNALDNPSYYHSVLGKGAHYWR